MLLCGVILKKDFLMITHKNEWIKLRWSENLYRDWVLFYFKESEDKIKIKAKQLNKNSQFLSDIFMSLLDKKGNLLQSNDTKNFTIKNIFNFFNP